LHDKNEEFEKEFVGMTTIPLSTTSLNPSHQHTHNEILCLKLNQIQFQVAQIVCSFQLSPNFCLMKSASGFLKLNLGNELTARALACCNLVNLLARGQISHPDLEPICSAARACDRNSKNGGGVWKKFFLF
jgi:hypothetical protein